MKSKTKKLTKADVVTLLDRYQACLSAVMWVRPFPGSPKSMWQRCEYGSWMFWILEKLSPVALKDDWDKSMRGLARELFLHVARYAYEGNNYDIMLKAWIDRRHWLSQLDYLRQLTNYEVTEKLHAQALREVFPWERVETWALIHSPPRKP